MKPVYVLLFALVGLAVVVGTMYLKAQTIIYPPAIPAPTPSVWVQKLPNLTPPPPVTSPAGCSLFDVNDNEIVCVSGG